MPATIKDALPRLDDAYLYSLELFRDGDRAAEPLATQAVAVDFSPAKEWAVFQRCRQVGGEAAILDTSQAMIVPRWHESLGKPYLDGVEVQVTAGDDPPLTFRIPLTYFKDVAQEAATTLVEKGQLEETDTYQYQVCAFPRELPSNDNLDESKQDFTVESIVAPLKLVSCSLSAFVAQSTSSGTSTGDCFPVFLPQYILDETTALMRSAGVNETGGVLIGHLRSDDTSQEIFAEVTAQIPARHTEQSSTRLKFTADTWADVAAALKIRAAGERYLGWWHSHNAKAWCKDCPVENRRQCKLSGEFFSSHDAALHRTCFPKAYSVALVISDSYANGLTWPLFGWHHGMVVQRGFQILGAESAHAVLPATTSEPVLQGD